MDRPVSPEGDIESTDYIDLLLEYDQLKKELDTLEEDDCVIQDPPTTPKYGKKVCTFVVMVQKYLLSFCRYLDKFISIHLGLLDT